MTFNGVIALFALFHRIR